MTDADKGTKLLFMARERAEPAVMAGQQHGAKTDHRLHYLCLWANRHKLLHPR